MTATWYNDATTRFMIEREERSTLVFVYGSLLTDLANHSVLGDSELIADGIVSGYRMYDLGCFPAVRPCVDDRLVIGEVYACDDATMARLDRLEGCPRFYYRSTVRVQCGDQVLNAVIYVLSRETSANVVESGDWKRYFAGDDEFDDEQCPGCGCYPGEDVSEDCFHEDGCGYYKEHCRMD